MTATISHSVRDMNNIEIVSVIASFDTDGHIKPLYVRIDGQSLKVASSWIKHGFMHSTTFQCQVVDNDVLKPIELTYYTIESVWTTPKIPSY